MAGHRPPVSSWVNPVTSRSRYLQISNNARGHHANRTHRRCIKRLIGDLNRVYRREASMHKVDFSPAGFEWVDVGNAEMSVIAFLRKSDSGAPPSAGIGTE